MYNARARIAMKSRRGARFVQLSALCLVAILPLVWAAPSGADALPIAPGVTAQEIRDEDAPWEIRVIRVERNVEAVDLVTAMGRGQLSGLEGLSRIIARETADDARVVAAVNGDFFQMAHRPFPGGVSGVLVRNGELITTPRGRAGFYVMADGSPRIETTQTTGELTVGERLFPVGGMNMPDLGAEGTVQLFTEIGGWEIPTGSLVVALGGAPLRTAGRWQGVVAEVCTPGTERSARAGEVLIAARDAEVTLALLQARPGERVEITLHTEPFSEPVLQAIGGNPVLVRGGEIVAADQVRHPRTAIGFNDKEIIIVVVDGRRPGWSVGMNMRELAELMHSLGCTEAMNLDGGGSSTAWVRDRVVNRPSDGGERSVANALLVVTSAPRGAPELLQVLPTAAVLMPGAELPLKVEVTDRWHNLLDANPQSFGAEIVKQEGPGAISVQLRDGVLSATGGPGRATVRIFYREAAQVASTIEIELVEQPATLSVVPAELRLLPGASGTVGAVACAEDGQEIVVPADAVGWRIEEGRGIEHLGAGRFRAEVEGATARVSASVGGIEASGLVRSSREVVVDDFAGDRELRFRGIPDSVSAELSLATDEFDGREMTFCRMTYDLGDAQVTRAAYMGLNRNIGDALGVSMLARAGGRTAWVRAIVADGTGAGHLLTLATALSPDEGWRRLELKLPADISGPIVLQSVYVVATAGNQARGVLDVADVRAMVLD